MPSLKLSRILLVAALLFTFFIPQVTLGAEACTCFCGTNSTGAVPFPAPQTNGATCAKQCHAGNAQYVGCFIDPEFFPENNDKCWTESECSAWTDDGEGTEGTWSGQEIACSKSRSGAEMGYCYSPPRTARLNIPLLGQESVSGFPEYLALAYKFLLPAMSLIAVVMVMVGGLQYMTASGSPKAVDQAKERIKNALIGLVLLMSAYALARLVDPRLVEFGQLRVPLIKQAVLLDVDTSCEKLSSDYGFKIDPPTGACGTEGRIESIDGVKDNVLTSNFPVNDTCSFMGCSGGEACVTTGTGNTCMACRDVSTVGGSGLTPSDSTCHEIASRANAFDPDPMNVHYCAFRSDGDNECLQFSSRTDEFVNCRALRSDLANTSDACSLYEDVLIKRNGVGLDYFLRTLIATDVAEEFCEDDPCGLAKLVGSSGCQFTPGSVGGSIVLGTFFNSCTTKPRR